jgi:hypothetical protein
VRLEGRMCRTGKIGWTTEDEAKVERKNLIKTKNYPEHTHYYPCHYCSGALQPIYHLTTNPSNDGFVNKLTHPGSRKLRKG